MIALLVALRLVVAALVAFGPWTNSAADLDGWDVARFHEIANDDGRPYVDREVEYPPGSVFLAEAVGWGSVPLAHRLVVFVALTADLAIAACAKDAWGHEARRRYLLLGTFLLPTMYLRFDIVAALLAVLAWQAFRRRATVRYAAAIAAGFLVKTWPLVLIGLALAHRRWRDLAVATATVAVVLAGWVAYAGLDGPRQVASFRGAEGWHVESVPGLVVSLIGGGAVAIEQGAFRFGHVPAAARLGGLVLAGVCAAVAWLPSRRVGSLPSGRVESLPSERVESLPSERVESRDALGATISVLALLVTSTLLSPQFIVWLLPFVALGWDELPADVRRLGAWCVVITGVAALIVAPASADELGPQLVLLVRNAVLCVTLAIALRSRQRAWSSARTRPTPQG